MGDTLLGEKGSVMMEGVKEVKRGKKNKKGKESRFGKRYGFDLKLRCVKLRLEEGLPVSLLSKEVGVSKDVIYRWVRAYQARGEAGLRNEVKSSGSRRKLPGPVRKRHNTLYKGGSCGAVGYYTGRSGPGDSKGRQLRKAKRFSGSVQVQSFGRK